MNRKDMIWIFITTFILFMSCGKDNGSGPSNNNKPDFEIGSFKFLYHNTIEVLPNIVEVLFNVVDLDGTPVDDLTADRFVVKENGIEVNENTASVRIQKRDELDYEMYTLVLLDVSSGVDLESLKNAAKAFVSTIDDQQTVGISVFSDETQTIQDFTKDKATLDNAIDNITEGSGTTNLYGAIIDGGKLIEDIYTASVVKQGIIVLFTDGKDTKGKYPQAQALNITDAFNFMTIGLGQDTDIDTDFLGEAGNLGFIQVQQSSELSNAFTEAQTLLTQFADSFYKLRYYTSLIKVGGIDNGEQEVEITILANLNQGDGSSAKDKFDSSKFTRLNNGLYINWAEYESTGIVSMMVRIGLPRKVKALSVGGQKEPEFTYKSSDESIFTVTALPDNNDIAIITATGAVGQADLTVKDVANNLTKVINIEAITYYYGFILSQWWFNPTNSTYRFEDSPYFPGYPDGSQFVNKFDIGSRGDYYGQRVNGYIHPDTSGTYSFWIAADTGADLFLSTDENPENKTRICYVGRETGARQFNLYREQHSGPVQLEGGKVYYIEALHYADFRSDHVSAAWDGPGFAQKVLSGDYISAYIGD